MILSFEGKNIEELKEQIKATAKSLGLHIEDAQMSFDFESTNKSSQTIQATTTVSTVATPKRGRPAKAQAPVMDSPVIPQEEAVTAPLVEATPDATLEEAKQAAISLSKRRDIQAVKGVLSTFQVGKVTELPLSKYGAFVEACAQA